MYFEFWKAAGTEPTDGRPSRRIRGPVPQHFVSHNPTINQQLTFIS